MLKMKYKGSFYGVVFNTNPFLNLYGSLNVDCDMLWDSDSNALYGVVPWSPFILSSKRCFQLVSWL